MSKKSIMLNHNYAKVQAKVRFFHLQSNQIWSPIYWSSINLMFRIDCRSTVFRFSMHFRSSITWSAISWSAVNRAYFMPIWLAESYFNLRCCANGHALRVEAIGSKRRHSNDINDTSAVKNTFYRKSNYMKASIHFISPQNTTHMPGTSF